MEFSRDVKRYLENWRGEIDSIYLYTSLSRSEKNVDLAKVYAKLAVVEDRHAKFWEQKITEAGGKVPARHPRLRPRVLGFFGRRFGARFVLPTVMGLENADNASYGKQPESKHTSLPGDERSHMRMLKAISQNSPKGMAGGVLAKLEGRHRSIGGNALRAAVLGANDGLVSNLSLIMGIAGAALSGQTILVAGFAGLLAGAFSMAMGEWLSVQSSRELYTRQIQVEAQELAEAPQEEQEELALIYEAKGLPKKRSRKTCRIIDQGRKERIEYSRT